MFEQAGHYTSANRLTTSKNKFIPKDISIQLLKDLVFFINSEKRLKLQYFIIVSNEIKVRGIIVLSNFNCLKVWYIEKGECPG